MQPRHIGNLSWSFAVRKAYDPALYNALAMQMVQLLAIDRVSAGSAGSDSSAVRDSLFLSEDDLVLPHHLSLVAWSFAKQVSLLLLLYKMQAVPQGSCQLPATQRRLQRRMPLRPL